MSYNLLYLYKDVSEIPSMPHVGCRWEGRVLRDLIKSEV